MPKKPHLLRLAGLPAVIMLLLLFAFTASACNYSNKYEKRSTSYGTRNYHPDGDPAETRMYGLTGTGGHNHDNKSLSYSSDLSYSISGVPGVLAAVVMLTDKNAYAAIALDSTGTGTVGGNQKKGTQAGTGRGMYNVYTGSQYMDPNKLVDEFNAYTVENHEHLSDKFKQHIAVIIRRLKPYILEVHISANKDFINQMNVFAQEYRSGEDMQKHLDHFNKFVTHYFGVNPVE